MRSNTVTEIQRAIAETWLNELYARLRVAEAAAANADLTLPSRRAAEQHACYIAGQIMAFEEWIGRSRAE
jgi:hypothetical protein